MSVLSIRCVGRIRCELHDCYLYSEFGNWSTLRGEALKGHDYAACIRIRLGQNGWSVDSYWARGKKETRVESAGFGVKGSEREACDCA